MSNDTQKPAQQPDTKPSQNPQQQSQGDKSREGKSTDKPAQQN